MSDVARYFRSFGDRLEAQYRQANYAEDDFPAIARQALESTAIQEEVDPRAVLEWACSSSSTLPNQLTTDLRFGQPPVTVYWASRFLIDIYFWFDGTTDIHEHAFCGAFKVLTGASLHAVRRFECEREINRRFLLGTIDTQLCEVLTVGATRTITAGGTFAHSLFHLERPSTTVVVRTRDYAGLAAQFVYFPPHVAFDGFYRPYARELQQEALAALAQMDADRYWQAFTGALREATVEETFHILHDYVRRNDDADLGSAPFVSALEHVTAKHGSRVAAQLERCMRWVRRERDLKSGRALARNADERFALGVLLNAHDRRQVLEYVRSRFPDRDPVDAFMAIFEQIATTEGGAENPLGFEIGQDALLLIRFLLEGVNPRDLSARLVRAGRSESVVQWQEAQIQEFYETLKRTPALQVLVA